MSAEPLRVLESLDCTAARDGSIWASGLVRHRYIANEWCTDSGDGVWRPDPWAIRGRGPFHEQFTPFTPKLCAECWAADPESPLCKSCYAAENDPPSNGAVNV